MSLSINLKRPICFFDLETTGVNIAKDRIVEISILKAFPGGSEQKILGLLIQIYPFQQKRQPYTASLMKRLQMLLFLKKSLRKSTHGLKGQIWRVTILIDLIFHYWQRKCCVRTSMSILKNTKR